MANPILTSPSCKYVFEILSTARCYYVAELITVLSFCQPVSQKKVCIFSVMLRPSGEIFLFIAMKKKSQSEDGEVLQFV